MTGHAGAEGVGAQGVGAAEVARRDGADAAAWRRWGPYLAERAWATVREDYSADGDAWGSFPHDHARSRTYRWSEDGLAGLCDDEQRVCFSLAFWNGADPILKERAFGLTGPEGNHGEDVKEYFWYTDATPTASWLSWRYVYPQRPFPYDDLVATNARRSRLEPEYELLDTGVFDDDRYFDVTMDVAKASPDDLRIRVRVVNRGPDPAVLHLLPTLWFRDTWSWAPGTAAPLLEAADGGLAAHDPQLGTVRLTSDRDARALVCDNATNTQRLWGQPGPAHPKDGIGDQVIHGAPTVAPDGRGTKGALQHVLEVGAGATVEVRLRLSIGATDGAVPSDGEWQAVLDARRTEADAFHATLARERTPEQAHVIRSALAGMLWSQEFYHYDVARWLDGDPGRPAPPPERLAGRNRHWRGFRAEQVMSMPDPWEYPWFAAWDLAFHCVTLAHVDPAFAKLQLSTVLGDGWMHPNGQVPAYEYDFGAVNPPVHAWAALQVFRIDGSRDTAWLRQVFERLLVNRTWWVDQNDPEGDGTFSGGFLGMDNIGPFDRGETLPEGYVLQQADATGWMALFSVTMLEIAVLLCTKDPELEDMALLHFEEFALIARAADSSGLWHEDDGFFYDQLVRGSDRWPVDVRSMVGLVPLFAVAALPADAVAGLPRLKQAVDRFIAEHRRAAAAADLDMHRDEAALLALVDRDRLARVIERLGDPDEFLSPHGIRSLSAAYRGAPYVFRAGVEDGTSIDFEPAESTTALFGGNSNWRGPVWMPVNALLLASLRHYARSLGDDLLVTWPKGAEHPVPLSVVAEDLADRLASLYLPDASGRRAVWGGTERFVQDPSWRDALLFFEYFEADDGAGLGAMHQTGWTGLVADVLLSRPPIGPDAPLE